MASMATSLDVTSSRPGPPQWPQWRCCSTSPTFDLGHLNDLNEDVVVEVDVKEVLKSSIFVVQKAAAPKSGVEFRQGSIGTIRSSLATSCDVSRRRARSPNFDQSEALKLSQIHRYTDRESTYCQALLYEQRLQKTWPHICQTPHPLAE